MSLLRETLESGKFAVTTEMAPPKGTDLSHLLKCAKPLVGRVHAANVTDMQSMFASSGYSASLSLR